MVLLDVSWPAKMKVLILLGFLSGRCFRFVVAVARARTD